MSVSTSVDNYLLKLYFCCVVLFNHFMLNAFVGGAPFRMATATLVKTIVNLDNDSLVSYESDG